MNILKKYLPLYTDIINIIANYSDAINNINKLDASNEAKHEIIYAILKKETNIIKKIEDNKELIEEFENYFISDASELLEIVHEIKEKDFKKSIITFLVLDVLTLDFKEEENGYTASATAQNIFECISILILYFKK